jgi:hypothetical protein
MVRVAAVIPMKVRLCGRLDAFRNVIEIGPVAATTVSAGSKAVVSPRAVVIVTSTVAAGLGLAGAHAKTVATMTLTTTRHANGTATAGPRTRCRFSGRRSSDGC